MRKGRQCLWIVTIIIAGFIGSAGHHWLCSGETQALAAEPGVAPGEVRATRFVLVDATGNVRAILGDFQWATGAKTAIPDWQEDAPATGLVVYGEQGKPHVQLATTAKGAYLDMRHNAGRTLCGVSDATAGMRLYSPEKTMRLGMGVARAGNGGMMMMDLKGRQRYSMGMPAHAGASIGLLDENGEHTWYVP
jgi:hypothetical protein